MVGKDHLLCAYNKLGTRTGPPEATSTSLSPSRGCDAKCSGEEGAFDQYREAYFEGNVSLVYFWDLDNGFVGVFIINKAKSKS